MRELIGLLVVMAIAVAACEPRDYSVECAKQGLVYDSRSHLCVVGKEL